MSNTNLEDVIVQLTETRNELSEEDLRLWDGLENERVSRIAGDDANKSLTLQVQDSVSGTERRLSTEVIHREQGDLDKLGLLNQLSQSMSAYRIKTDKEIEAERFARDILGINLDARITTAEASFNHKELKLYQDIQEVFTDLDGKYTSMDARIKKYEELLQDITMDSIKITMDNGEINMGAWTILSQAREWDLEILAKMRGFQEKTNEDVNQALEELQNQLPITENIINEIMENLSDSPLIAELRDALNEGIDNTSDLAIELAKEKVARAEAIIDLAYANAQALAAEKAALAESLAAEAQARADEVQEEANRRIESIRQIRADLAQDVGELNDQVDTIREVATADKAGILETVNNYKTELKSDIATVNTELLGALDGVNTLVTEVRNENEVTLNELTTYKSSNDVAVAGLLSKITTNVSDTAANASKITGLTTELATTNTELGKVRNTSANALSKADTAVTANSALATRVDLLAAAITDLGEGAETAVDVFAFNALKAEVETNAAGVTSLVEQVDALGTSYTNLTDGVQANTDAVSTLTVKQSEMNGDISQLSSDVTFLTSELGVTNTALNTKASNQALSNLNTKLTTTDGKVDANTQQLTQLNTDLTTVKNGLETKASTEALNNLATEVTELEGGLAVNASAITNLKSEIDTELNKKATVTAVNGLTTKVNEVEGKTTANANNILALNTSVGNVVKGLATKLDASTISDYYTKSQSDAKASEIAAGKVEEFKADLKIGGRNLWNPSETISAHESSGSHTNNSNAAHRFLPTYLEVSGSKLLLQIWNPNKVINKSNINRVAFYTEDKTHISSSVLNLLSGETYQKQEFNIPANAKYMRLGVISGLSTYDQSIKFKFELGTVYTEWTASEEEVANAISSNSTAIQNTIAEVTRVDGRVTATNTAQTLLEGRVKHVEGDITSKADATALSSLDTRVGTVEGQYTTQASDITKLSNSLDTTNVNVGTAQTAAQNAMNAAGAKGKVIFGSSAPAVADRLVQNLWIDTTSNANTPKRWNGSTWVVVTDKVATDAAKAVKDLDTAVKTKADVSALNSLTTKVTDEANKTVANTNSITTLNSDIVKINKDIATKANASALSDMYTKTQADAKATEIAAGEVSKYDASLVIGGTNLYSGTTDEWKEVVFGGWQSYLHDLDISPNGSLNVGDVITWSGEVLDEINNALLMLHFVVPSTPLGYIQRHSSVAGAGEKAIVKGTTTVPEGATAVRMALRHDNGSAPISAFKFRRLQIEKGSKVTDWAPSPRDTKQALDANASAITNTNAEVTRVEGRVTTESDRTTALSGRVSTVENGLALKADVSALNNIYTKSESDAKATSLAAGEVSKYDASLVIGGTNLFSFSDSVAGYVSSSGALTNGAATHQSMTALIPLGSHKSMTYQVWNPAAILNTSNTNRIAFFKADGSFLSATALPQLNGTTYQTTLIQIPAAATHARLGVVVGTANGGRDEAVKVKIEFGNKATDWTPSNEEVQSSLDANASAISNTNAEVVKQSGRITANAARIDGLDTKINTVSGSKLDASVIGGYYTKAQTDTNIETVSAGKVEELKASLSYPAGQNQVANPDFSDGLAGWYVQSFNSKDTECESVVFSGKRAVKVQHKRTSGSVSFSLYANARKAIRMEAGRKYEMSVLYIADNIVGAVSGNFKLRFGEIKADGTDSLRTEIIFSSNTAGDWKKLTIPYTSTAGMNASLSTFLSFVSGTIYLTEFTFLDVTDREAITANTGSISTTNTEVSRINGVVSGHTTQLSNLTASVAGKANTSALNALTVRVEAEEGKSSTQATSITNLSSKLNVVSKQAISKEVVFDLTGLDSTKYYPVLFTLTGSNMSRMSVSTPLGAGSNGKPTWSTHGSGFSCMFDWESNGSGWGANIVTRTIKAADYLYTSNSQPPAIGITQFTSSSNECIYLRGGAKYTVGYSDGASNVRLLTASTTINSQIIAPIAYSDSLKITTSLNSKASASALSTLDTKVEEVDGKVSTQASQILTLTSDNAANKNALQIQAKVVDGVKANYMVKMETNGVIGGFGLMQSTGVLGQVVTSFGVNANSFFIGAPASKKQPFIVTTTNQVVNGVAYPAGTYIDVALIANATIGTAKIADLAVTGAKIANATIDNAKIANLDAAKINTGTLNAARIGVGSISADKINASVFKSVGADGSSSTISGGTIRAYYPNGKLAFHIGVG